MSEWKSVALGEVCDVTAGGTPSRAYPEYFGGGIPWVKIGDMHQGTVTATEETLTEVALTGSAAKLLPPGTVLISIFATIGRTAVLGVEAATNQAIAGVTPRDPATLTPGYLRHYFDSVVSTLERRARGVAQVNINSGILRSLPIPLPPLPEQRRIAEILDKADALRAKRRAALAQLDTLTQSIFLEMFGDPVSNPRGWPQENLATFFHFRTGKLDSNAAVASGQYPFFTCSRDDFRIDIFAFDCEALLLAGNNASADYSVKHYRGKFNAYQRTYVITLQDERNSYEYSRFVLEHRLAELKRLSKGTGTKYLTMELLNKIRVPVPPQERQSEFARRVAAVQKLKTAHRVSLAELDALFSALQHRAFRGEL